MRWVGVGGRWWRGLYLAKLNIPFPTEGKRYILHYFVFVNPLLLTLIASFFLSNVT